MRSGSRAGFRRLQEVNPSSFVLTTETLGEFRYPPNLTRKKHWCVRVNLPPKPTEKNRLLRKFAIEPRCPQHCSSRLPRIHHRSRACVFVPQFLIGTDLIVKQCTWHFCTAVFPIVSVGGSVFLHGSTCRLQKSAPRSSCLRDHQWNMATPF